MTLQNRVMPDGQVIATPARGMFMGNRGILHDDRQVLGPARWRHRNWVCCVLAFKGPKRALMAPHRYTELFFLDEAVALAAGHRPCAECRRGDFTRFRTAWAAAFGGVPSAPDLDRVLHQSRVTGRTQRTHFAPAKTLPNGAMLRSENRLWLVLHGQMRCFAPEGYGPPAPLPDRDVEVLTPAATVATLRAGYAPALHPTA
ncbi:MAG: hypothetical protein Q7J57_12520 [Gemmobacter sp.]|nr:hypothetical protein [Gemmobacter sp.]